MAENLVAVSNWQPKISLKLHIIGQLCSLILQE